MSFLNIIQCNSYSVYLCREIFHESTTQLPYADLANFLSIFKENRCVCLLSNNSLSLSTNA